MTNIFFDCIFTFIHCVTVFVHCGYSITHLLTLTLSVPMDICSLHCTWW